jgi:cold shock CspA family protein
MSTGTVQRFDDAIGFGVIVDAAAAAESFGRRGSLRISGATIHAGDRVELEAHGKAAAVDTGAVDFTERGIARGLSGQRKPSC